MVNTCAFIEAAREESIGAVLRAGRPEEARRQAGRDRVHGRALRPGAGRRPARSGPGGRLRRPGDPAYRAGGGQGGAGAAGPGAQGALGRRPPPAQLRPAQPAPPPGPGALGLRQGRGRLRPALRVLCHPLVPRPPAVANGGRRAGRGGGARCPGGRPGGPGPRVLGPRRVRHRRQDRPPARCPPGRGPPGRWRGPRQAPTGGARPGSRPTTAWSRCCAPCGKGRRG